MPQIEYLGLLTAGLTSSESAERIFYMEKTDLPGPYRLIFSFILIFLIGSGIPTATLFASSFDPDISDPLTEKWRWSRFPQLEGKGVRCLVEDQLGRTWFGVDEGVMMFNRREWISYGEETGLPAVPMLQLLAQRDGSIYAASASSIYVFNTTEWQPVMQLEDGETMEVYQLRELSDGSVMVATNYGVLHFQDEKILRVFTNRNQSQEVKDLFAPENVVILPDEANPGDVFHVSDVIEDSRDFIWFAISLGNTGTLVQFKQRDVRDDHIENVRVHTSAKQLTFGEDQRLIETLHGEIWVVNRSIKSGINIYDGLKWRSISLNKLFGTDEYCTGICQTEDGRIWIASLGKLYTYANSTWHSYRSSDYPLPANKIILAKSSAQRLWICGVKAQAFLFDYSDEHWVTYNDLNFQCEDSDGNLWFLDVSGAALIKSGNVWSVFDKGSGLIDAPVRIVSTSRGEIWAAGSDNGVAATARLNGKNWEIHRHPTLSWGIDYRAVFEAFDGSLWFGAAVDFDEDRGQRGGVMQLKFGENNAHEWIYHHYRENGLTQSNAYGIGQSRDSLIWIGGGSLSYYDGESWRRTDEPMLRDFVNIVYSTPDGVLLVGSRYYGIFEYDGQKWTQYNTESGLMSNTIMSLHSNAQGQIWAATENDISLFDGSNWVNAVLPEQMNIHFEGGSIFSSSDGAIWINQSMREWNRRAFASELSLNEIRPSYLTYNYKPDIHPPETEVEVYTKVVSPKGNTLVTWAGSDYMSSTAGDRLSYSYRLNGGDWSPFSTEKHQTFVNLANGNYTLEVRARDLDLNVDPTPALIEFEVQPPVWKQSWFILLILAFVFVIGLFEYRILAKNKKLERLNSSLSQINTQLHDTNAEIAAKNEEILKQQGQIIDQKQELEVSYQNLTSQNKEIESQRDQLAELIVKIKSLNAYKIKFFTNVSHELRTPLTLILGPAHQLQDNTNIEPVNKVKFLKIIERNAYKLLKLINQLLEMRRIESGQLELHLTHGSLAKFLDEILQLFENLATERNIRLTFLNTCHESLMPFDRDKIEKIVTNLISNAFKHTPSGGSITVKLSGRLEETVGEELKMFRITVEDTGTGIHEDRLPHIFERYYTDDSDRLSSGIGLSYIKDLVEMHHGSIAVDSRKGEGTRFFIDIPEFIPSETTEFISDKADSDLVMSASEVAHLFNLIEPDPEEVQVGPSVANRPTILIVENDVDLLDFLGSILEDKYNVIKAVNGLVGLEVSSAHNIDLIVSDIMMPVMDGIQMCNRIKGNVATSHIPVILLTAKAMDTHRVEGYNKGADAYLTKPFNPKVLISRIENLLSQRFQLREAFARDFILTPKHIKLNSVDEELIRNIVDIMEQHIDDAEFNVNRMCHMVGMSHTHFIRKVKQITGKKPLDLLKSFRLKRAKDLLAQKQANIAEVGYMVGYNLPNSFSRAFKKEFDISPSEFIARCELEENESGMRATDY